jgi:hypothetical protein
MIYASGNEEDGTLPMCISDDDLSIISVYFPTKGQCELELAKPDEYMLYWVNPRTGEKDKPWRCKSNCFETPPSNEGNEIWGDDWVLLLKK